MLVKALTAFSLGGGRDVYQGDVFDLSAPAAEAKIRAGWVVRADPTDKPRSAPAYVKPRREHPGTAALVPGAVQHRDPPAGASATK
jgi:hypothetical protein